MPAAAKAAGPGPSAGDPAASKPAAGGPPKAGPKINPGGPPRPGSSSGSGGPPKKVGALADNFQRALLQHFILNRLLCNGSFRMSGPLRYII